MVAVDMVEAMTEAMVEVDMAEVMVMVAMAVDMTGLIISRTLYQFKALENGRQSLNPNCSGDMEEVVWEVVR